MAEVIYDRVPSLCTVCLKEFQEPKLLPCFHIFCKNCVERLIETSLDAGSFRCPLCRLTIHIPQNGIDMLPNSFHSFEETEVKEFASCCRKHRGKKLKVYCRECSKPLCKDCLLVEHQHHHKVDLIDAGEEAKKELFQRTLDVEDHISRNNKASEKIKTQLDDLSATETLACQNVDDQTKKLCEEIIKKSENIKTTIRDGADVQREKLHNSQISLISRNNGLKQGADYAGVVLRHGSSVAAIDILPNVQHILIENCHLSNMDRLDIKYPFYQQPIGIRFQSIMNEFSGLQLMDAPTFSVNIHVDVLRGNQTHVCPEIFIIQNLPWCIETKCLRMKTQNRVGFYLALKNSADLSIRSCSAYSTIKLINHAFGILSITKSTVAANEYIPGANGCGWLFIDWEELMDPSFGFLKNSILTIQTSVKIADAQMVPGSSGMNEV